MDDRKRIHTEVRRFAHALVLASCLRYLKTKLRVETGV